MSIVAMTWVMKKAPIKNPAEGMILYALADRAHDDGTGCWPSQKWIASHARMSVATVKRHLAELERRGLIKRGDPAAVAHLPADRRPVNWTLCYEAVRDDEWEGDKVDFTRRGPAKKENTVAQNAPSKKYGSSNQEIRGLKTEIRGLTGELQTIPLNHPSNHPPENDVADEFTEFWDTYPKRVNKSAAERAWKVAQSQATTATIMGGLRAALVGWQSTELRWIPNPATWLRDERWLDHEPVGEKAKPERCEVCADNNGFIDMQDEHGRPYVVRCDHQQAA